MSVQPRPGLNVPRLLVPGFARASRPGAIHVQGLRPCLRASCWEFRCGLSAKRWHGRLVNRLRAGYDGRLVLCVGRKGAHFVAMSYWWLQEGLPAGLAGDWGEIRGKDHFLAVFCIKPARTSLGFANYKVIQGQSVSRFEGFQAYWRAIRVTIRSGVSLPARGLRLERAGSSLSRLGSTLSASGSRLRRRILSLSARVLSLSARVLSFSPPVLSLFAPGPS
jgi:hypothetical protein